MTQFNMELDLVSREVERLTAEINRLEIAYDLDDGVNDDDEQAEIDALYLAIGDLQQRREHLEVLEQGMQPAIDPTPVIELEPIDVQASGLIDYYDKDLQDYMGGLLEGWAGRCGILIVGTRGELNVQIPDDGFNTSSLVDVITIVPGVGPFVDAGNKIFGFLASGVRAIDIRPGRDFADVGHDLTGAFVHFQGLMDQDSPELREIYDSWVTAFRGNDTNDQVSERLIKDAIQSWVAGRVAPEIIARRFLLKCMECLDDPTLEWGPLVLGPDPFGETEGTETGDVTLHFAYRNGRWGYYGGYVDDAPQQLVDALRRNFGENTRCVDLPLAMRCKIEVYYRDRGDDDDDDSTTDTVDTYFLARRRSRTPGNTTFAYSLETGWSYEGRAKEEALAAWERDAPYSRITIGQLGGD